MRIAFFGTPKFAVPTLKALVEAGHEVVLVVTNPDRPRGRSGHPLPSEVKEAALALGRPTREVADIHDPDLLSALQGLDLGVVVAYGQLIPRSIRSAPRLGMINVHGSLLPRYRGASPISEAILRGDTETGVTVIEVARRMDAGAMLGRRAMPIRANDTTGSLSERLAQLGAELLVDVVAGLAQGTVERQEQDESAVSFAGKLQKEHGAIDWREPADHIERRVRAMDPWPQARVRFGAEVVIVERARCDPGSAPPEVTPGTVLSVADHAIHVATGAGVLILERLKPAGKGAMPAGAFARGRRLQPGSRFENG